MTTLAQKCQNTASSLQSSSSIPGTTCSCSDSGNYVITCNYDQSCSPGCGGTVCLNRQDIYTYSTNGTDPTSLSDRIFSNTYSGEAHWTHRQIDFNYGASTCRAFWKSDRMGNTEQECSSCVVCPATSDALTDCSNLQFQAKEPGCGLTTPTEARMNVCVEDTRIMDQTSDAFLADNTGSIFWWSLVVFWTVKLMR